jgi:hypothetical protein
VSLGDGVDVPDVGAKSGLVGGVVRGVIRKLSWIGTERTRRRGRAGGGVDMTAESPRVSKLWRESGGNGSFGQGCFKLFVGDVAF